MRRWHPIKSRGSWSSCIDAWLFLAKQFLQIYPAFRQLQLYKQKHKNIRINNNLLFMQNLTNQLISRENSEWINAAFYDIL